MKKSSGVMMGVASGLMALGASSSVMAEADVKGEHGHAHGDTSAELTTGQGSMVFTWDQGLTAAFPEAAKPFEPRMHGGFNEDVATGILYTGIPGYGLCSISANLKTWTLLGDDARLKDNIHGIVVFKHKGTTFLALAQQGNRRILITDLEGKVLQDIKKPTGTEFDFARANEWYSQPKAHFSCTDVTYLDGIIYAVTGYSKGDFVLTLEEIEGVWSWGKIAWGGKGKQPGEFSTAHGVFAHDDHIYVANREAHQVIKFTKDGKLVEILKDIPKESRVCNVAHQGENFIFCPLAQVAGSSSAPIYAHTGDKLVSTIIPGDLKIPVLNNIHHAWPHIVKEGGKEQLYILVHGWSKGKYAVLKHKK